jgi:hypothetical protein
MYVRPIASFLLTCRRTQREVTKGGEGVVGRGSTNGERAVPVFTARNPLSPNSRHGGHPRGCSVSEGYPRLAYPVPDGEPATRLGLRNGSVWVGDASRQNSKVRGATGIPDPRIPSRMGRDPSPSLYRRELWDRDGTSPISDKVLGSVYRPSDLVGDRAGPIPIPYWRPEGE